ncbi:alpha/beta fold hydrolase [Nocardia nova]|uniref:alpha/beta fold hydrolase n=1 Tax=Nocardia nova TaxID=37330 RepID=UPI0033E456BC
MSAGTRLPGTPEPKHLWRLATGATIAGDSWGDPGGPLVVLLHGGGQTRHAWKGAGQALAAAGYRAVAYDARGHGDSDWAADGRYTQNAHVADLCGVLDALGDHRPVLVGASMGGGTSLVAVGEGAVDATALVLVDIAHRIEAAGADNINRFMDQKPDGFDNLEEVAEAIAGYRPHTPRPRTSNGLAKNVRLGDDGRYHWHWDPRIRHRTSDLNDRQKRLEGCARDLALPTLLVRGGLSDVLSAAAAGEFLELVPHAEYRNVTGAGHMVAGDRNDAFVAAIIDFLARTVPAGTTPVQPQSADPANSPPIPGDFGSDITDIP